MKTSLVWRAAWALMACLALFAGQWLPAAEAHAMLVAAYPAPGATLDATPLEIRLTFSERIGPGSTLQLFGPQFRAVPGVQSGLDPAAPELLRAIPPELSPDTYTVEWSVVSLDGHPVSGSYQFAVKSPSAAAPAVLASAPWLWGAGLLAALAIVGAAAWEIRRRRHAAGRQPGGGTATAQTDRPKGNF